MKRKIFWLTIILTTALVGYYVMISLWKNDGNLIYPVDDAYIHLAIAKNFATKGVWGATPYQFTSSTSSPVYTLLLSAFIFLFGNNTLYPLILNFVFAFFFLQLLYRFAVKRWSDLTYLVVSLSVVLLTPLHTIVLAGMEHTLHILVLFLILNRITEIVETTEPIKPASWIILLLLSFIVMLIRYESAFILTLFGFLLILKKRPWPGIAVFAFSIIPVVVYGLICVKHGAYFLPNSLLVKASLPGASVASLLGLVSKLYKSFFNESPHIGFLVVLVLICVYAQLRDAGSTGKGLWNSWLQIIWIIAAVAHLTFGKTGWFFRYEAYLIAVGVVALAPLVRSFELRWRELSWEKISVIAATILLCLVPLLFRVAATFYQTQHASNNIYEQQYQVARFLNRFYNTSAVALNDIGAVVYLTEIHLFDLAGLGSNEMIVNKDLPKMEVLKAYGASMDFKAVVLYESIFGDIIPPGWIKVATWTIRENRICASDTVSFFAPNCESARILIMNLKTFSSDLDPDVREKLIDRPCP